MFIRITPRKGRFYWQLLDARDDVIARGARSYARYSDALRAVATIYAGLHAAFGAGAGRRRT